MSFVINKSQYKSLFDINKSLIPGPGAYQIQHQIKIQNPAPFNASASKQSCFSFKQTNLGPGSYNKTSISQCYKTKTTCATTFKSKQPRFPYQRKNNKKLNTQQSSQNKQLSLLQCQNNQNNRSQSLNQRQSDFRKTKLNQKKQYLNQLRKRNQQRKINSIVSQQKGKVRILLSNPQNTQNIESFYIEDYVHLKQYGPGQYQVSKSLVQKNKSVIDWAKDKQSRFRKSKSMINTNPGPGQYQLNKKNHSSRSKRLTSSFSFGGVRSFMDTIIYKTSNKIKAQIYQQKKIKDSSPGPADYSPQKPHKQTFYYGKEIMSSTVQRFQMDKTKISVPGPGYYRNAQCQLKYSAMVKEARQKIFGKQAKLARQPNEQNFVSLQKQLNNQKSAQCLNHQQMPICTLKQRCQSKAGTISHQPRFKHLQKNKAPGPGQYYSLFQIKSPPQTSGIFKSTTERQPFKINKQNASASFYQVNNHDIAAKTQKIRQNIESLKKVSIQKPGFDSSVIRFIPHHLMNSYSQKALQPARSTSYQRDQINYQQFKPYKEKTSYASVFRSTTNRQPFILKNNPGPGTYQKSDLLNKKSFNIQYHQRTRLKKGLSNSKKVQSSIQK